MRPMPSRTDRWVAAWPWAVFALLTAVSWKRWIEPFIDSGRELMVPWRIATGERLYRQIQFFHGPLAPYIGAGIDSLFGRCLATRVLLAALIAVLGLEALRRLARVWFAPARGALVVSLAVAVAFFLRPGGWLFPFSFDTAIAVAALTWALWLETGEDRHPAASPTSRKPRGEIWTALCLLVALLSRIELGMLGVVAISYQSRATPRRLTRIVLPPLILTAAAYFTLSFGVPLHRLIAGGWLAVIHPPAAFRSVYLAYSGLDRPVYRLLEIALVTFVLLGLASFLLASAVLAEKASHANNKAGRAIEVLAVALVSAAGWFCFRSPAWLASILRITPPLVRVVPLLVLLSAAWILLRRGLRGALQDRMGEFSDAVLIISACFGLRLLLAAGYVGPYDAFFLPLPLLLALALLFRAIGPFPVLTRLVTASLVVFLFFRVAVVAESYHVPAWSMVATPAGGLYLPEPIAGSTRLALADLQRRLPPDGTLVGFPEGGFFNYVLDKRNPLPAEQFFPGRLEPAEEQRVIDLIRRRPPDAAVLIDVIAVGEGAPVFGRDYLPRLGKLIEDDFRPVAIFGPGARKGARIGDRAFFIEIRVPRNR
jgi:hypothetical protein